VLTFRRGGLLRPSIAMTFPFLILEITNITLAILVCIGVNSFDYVVASIDISSGLMAVMLFSRMVIEPSGSQRKPSSVNGKRICSGLDVAVRNRIRRKLRYAMNTERLFTDKDLTLSMLCAHIGEYSEHVLTYLNKEQGVSFYQFINQHRITHAQRLALKISDSGVDDIAGVVGFPSTSTFNSTFKRFVGQSPRQYRYSHQCQK